MLLRTTASRLGCRSHGVGRVPAAAAATVRVQLSSAPQVVVGGVGFSPMSPAYSRPCSPSSSLARRSIWQLAAPRRPQWARAAQQRADNAAGGLPQGGAAGQSGNNPSDGAGAASSGATTGARSKPPPPTPRAFITWRSAIVALGAFGLVLAYFEIERAKRKSRIEIAVVGTPAIGGPFTLVDQEGRIVTNHMFKGRYMLLYFGFTFCPDICPAELTKISKAIQILEEEEGITPGLVVPIFVSVDPFRDTVGKVRTYLKDFHPAFVGLTGTPQQVESMARLFRVYSSTSQHSEEDQDYLVDHSIFVYLLDKDGNFLSHHGSQYDASALAKRIAEDVRSKGDCPPSLWTQVKEKAKKLLGSHLA